MPAKPLKKRYPKPGNVAEFASTIRTVAIEVLNEEIDDEKARIFSGLARAAAQLISAETTRARIEKRAGIWILRRGSDEPV